jgi:hypothetical protein
MISLFDNSSIVESFKIIKFKRNLKKNNYDFCFEFFKDSLIIFKIIKFKINLKKLIIVSLFDTSSTVESFKI